MFRLPRWVRLWLNQKFSSFNIDPKSAEQKKLFLSLAYVASAFIFANYMILKSGTPGISKEDEKLLSSGEKVLLSINPTEAKVIKYRFGVGVTSEETVKTEDIRSSLEQRRLEAAAPADDADTDFS